MQCSGLMRDGELQRLGHWVGLIAGRRSDGGSTASCGDNAF
jgi:hypothetical protein